MMKARFTAFEYTTCSTCEKEREAKELRPLMDEERINSILLYGALVVTTTQRDWLGGLACCNIWQLAGSCCLT